MPAQNSAAACPPFLVALPPGQSGILWLHPDLAADLRSSRLLALLACCACPAAANVCASAMTGKHFVCALYSSRYSRVKEVHLCAPRRSPRAPQPVLPGLSSKVDLFFDVCSIVFSTRLSTTSWHRFSMDTCACVYRTTEQNRVCIF